MSRNGRPTRATKPTRRESRKSAKSAVRPRPNQAKQLPDLEPARWIAANGAIVIASGVIACQ